MDHKNRPSYKGQNNLIILRAEIGKNYVHFLEGMKTRLAFDLFTFSKKAWPSKILEWSFKKTTSRIKMES